MKKLLLLLLASGLALSTFAQGDILNGGFEDTTIVNIDVNTKDTIINHWTSLDMFGAGITTDAYSGDLAAYVWNWYYYVPGKLSNGYYTIWPDLAGGTPLSFKPTSLTGFYKYIAGDTQSQSDSGIAEIWLFKFDVSNNTKDTVGYGIKKLPLISNYTEFVVDINYTSQEMPDTVLVQFTSSENGFCNGNSTNCLFLYLDDIALTSPTGIKEEVDLHQEMMVYPNPATGNLFINTTALDKTDYTIINALGEVVLTGQLTGNSEITMLDISSLSPGLYVLNAGIFSSRFVKQ